MPTISITRRRFAAWTGAFVGLALGGPPAKAAPPPRIAAIDWGGAEALLALGLAPVGVSDSAYYRQRMAEPVLPEDVPDIGPFWEVNMELLSEIEPDLILANAGNLRSMPALSRIAPVEIVPDAVPPKGRYALGQVILRRVAELVDRQAEAESLIEAATLRLAGYAGELRNAIQRPAWVLLPNSNGRNATVYGRNSLPDAVFETLGLTNAFDGRTNAAGVATVGVEALLDRPDAVILMIDIPSARRRIEVAMARSGLWQAMEPVRAGRTAFLQGFYPFGGIPSALRLAADLRRLLPVVA